MPSFACLLNKLLAAHPVLQIAFPSCWILLQSSGRVHLVDAVLMKLLVEDPVLQIGFPSCWILRQSCSHVHVEESGFLNLKIVC